MKKLLCILLLVSACISRAQFSPEEKNIIDSLNKVVSAKVTDTVRADVYVKLSELYAASRPDTVISLCRKAIIVAAPGEKSTRNPKILYSFRATLAAAYNNIGYIFMNLGQNDSALVYYKLGLLKEQQNNNRHGMASAYNNIGLLFHSHGDIPSALEYYNKSLAIKEEFGDKKGMAMTLNNIGYIHREQGNTKLAVEYYNRAYDLNKELNNKKGMSMCLNNIGLVYFNVNETDKAEVYYRRSLKLKEELQDKKGIANSLHNLGKLKARIQQDDSTRYYFELAYSIRKEVGDKEGIGFSSYELGNYFLKKNMQKEARKFLEDGIQIGKELGSPELLEKNAGVLCRIAAKEGKWKEAYELNVLYNQMHDSIASEASFKAAANQEAQYKFEQERAAGQLVQAKKDAEAIQEKQKQRFILFSTIAGLTLVLAFMFLLYRRFRISQRQNKIIQRQKLLMEEKQKEILDSIHYARRIQRTLITSEFYISKSLKKLNKK